MMVRLIKKPWGYEEIWAETDKYVGKFLHINAGFRLSRQYHNVKTETIRVLEGKLILETADGAGGFAERTLDRGEVFHVSPGTIHRFGAREVPVVLVEVSTPELDDVVRLEDDYARQ
jgi:mannose-6-phosphate isomerase-like protein (cupin superfamily)